jgi:hypothetical protein
MDEVIAGRLREMDFYLALKACAECRYDIWSRDIEYGNVKSIVCIRETVEGFDYRFALFQREEAEEETWGFEGNNSWNALGCMLETWCVLREARRCLEGGIVRRSMRRLLKQA